MVCRGEDCEPHQNEGVAPKGWHPRSLFTLASQTYCVGGSPPILLTWFCTSYQSLPFFTHMCVLLYVGLPLTLPRCVMTASLPRRRSAPPQGREFESPPLPRLSTSYGRPLGWPFRVLRCGIPAHASARISPGISITRACRNIVASTASRFLSSITTHGHALTRSVQLALFALIKIKNAGLAASCKAGKGTAPSPVMCGAGEGVMRVAW